MGLFSRTPPKQSYIGIDLGVSGIKLVELVNERGRARLNTYAFANLPPSVGGPGFLEKNEAVAAVIANMVKKSRCMTNKVVTALPIPSVFTSIITIPTGTDKEMKEAVQLQAKKLIPMPIEEIVLDFKVIETASGDAGKKVSRVLLTGAPKTLVQKYVDIFKRAGLELASLETEIFAQIRSLIGKDRSTIMIIDIGSERTNISVVEKGVPFLTRSIAAGGAAVTNIIAKTLGIPEEQAETMKRDIRALQSFAPTGDVTPMLQTLLKPIVDEIRYSFNLYQSQQEGGQAKRIDKIIITGGSSLLPKLPEFLTQLMNVNAYLGDPWARVIYPPDLRPVLDEIGPRYTIALGCAMRDIDA